MSQDFGTTHSGVAYVYTAKPADIHVVTVWSTSTPDDAARSSFNKYGKCPTLLEYEADGSIIWGYRLDYGLGDDSMANRIEAFKLLLDPEQAKSLPCFDHDTAAMLKKHGKEPSDVVLDYMKALITHASTKIASERIPGYFEGLKKEFVLTIPAIWSEKSEQAILNVRQPNLPYLVKWTLALKTY